MLSCRSHQSDPTTLTAISSNQTASSTSTETGTSTSTSSDSGNEIAGSYASSAQSSGSSTTTAQATNETDTSTTTTTSTETSTSSGSGNTILGSYSTSDSESGSSSSSGAGNEQSANVEEDAIGSYIEALKHKPQFPEALEGPATPVPGDGQMKITAHGGTDAATIALFWPDNLPEGADRLLQKDPLELAESLRKEGRLLWFPCDGDGDYTVAIFVRSPVPDYLRALCEDEERYPTLVVKGQGYFGGGEYMFKHDSSFLKKHPRMCERVVVPEGAYAATVYRTNVPEEIYEAWLKDHAGSRAKRLWDFHGVLAACSVAAVVLSLISFAFPWVVRYCVMAATLVLVGLAVGLSRTKAYRSVAAAQKEYEKAYPGYVVHLE
jgi:hypothetical protein